MIVELQGIHFEVEYHSFAGAPATSDTPEDPPEFWLTSVKIDDYELINLLTDETIDALEEKTAKQLLMEHEP
jgi:hypothetical protein